MKEGIWLGECVFRIDEIWLMKHTERGRVHERRHLVRRAHIRLKLMIGLNKSPTDISFSAIDLGYIIEGESYGKGTPPSNP